MKIKSSKFKFERILNLMNIPLKNIYFSQEDMRIAWEITCLLVITHRSCGGVRQEYIDPFFPMENNEDLSFWALWIVLIFVLF